MYSPQVIKSKFRPLMINKEYCLYVGKSENLPSRISQHVHQKTKNTTFGLKLSEHDGLINDIDLSYSYFVFGENPDPKIKDAMKCLVVTLEKYLRSELKPLIGKQ